MQVSLDIGDDRGMWIVEEQDFLPLQFKWRFIWSEEKTTKHVYSPGPVWITTLDVGGVSRIPR